MPASVSSWTRAAKEDLDAADEPAELEDDAEPLIEEEDDPRGWSVFGIGSRALWKLPPGASVRKKMGRRKRKKRRKRRTPRSPRPLLRARARCRQRQCRLSGLPCDVFPRAVLPSVEDRPKMLDIMAGMKQKNSYVLLMCYFSWLFCTSHCVAFPVFRPQKEFGMCKASGLSSFSAVSLIQLCIHALRQSARPLVGRPAAGSASWPAWTRLTVWVVLLVTILLALCSFVDIPSSGMCTAGFTGYAAPRAVSFVVVTPKMLGILVDMDLMDSYGDVGKDFPWCGARVHCLLCVDRCRMVQTVQKLWSPQLVLPLSVSVHGRLSSGNGFYVHFDGDLAASSFSVSCVLGSVAQGFKP